ncbi:MAG: hypothetical protein H7Z16_08240 [Pyrinomonadaceae bacterium]|nr:hypothetical protein [Pyrinomonadaceae bacterium]
MNYFNYFTEIEDAFVRRRGKHLLVSSIDWSLIETWKEMGVPLHIVLRGIEKAFDSWESKPRKRSVKSLMYCQEEVDAQFAEWREARVGAADAPAEGDQNEGGADSLPFSRVAILEHLQGGHQSLLAAGTAYEAQLAGKQASSDTFSETLVRAAALLREVAQDFTATAVPDAQKLEQSLSGLERMLSDAVGLVIESDQLDRLKQEVKEQLSPYRKQMEKAVYQQTFDNLLLKQLREQFGVPRLSLFYL